MEPTMRRWSAKRFGVWRAVSVLACAGMALLPLAWLIARNIADPNLSFDEAGQFWIARGLFHYAAPRSPIGTFADVIAHNARWNWDPGGFTLLCSVWTSLDTSPAFLRALPFAFFVLAVIAVAALGYQLSGDVRCALVVGVTPLWFPLLVHHAFEFRAYSMEAAGVLGSLVLLNVLTSSTTGALIWQWGALGLLLAIALTSRYSFAVVAVVAGVRLLLARQLTGRVLLPRVASVVVPVVLVAAVIVLWSGHVLPFHPVPLSYVDDLMLRGKPLTRQFALLRRNLLSPAGMYLLACPLAYLVARRWIAAPRRLLFRNVIAVALGSDAAFAVLSLLGWHPWCVDTKWSMSLIALSCASLAAVVSMLWDVARGRRFAIAVTCLIVWSVAVGVASTRHYVRTDSTMINLSALDERTLRSARFYVSAHAGVTARYLLEYGPLQHVVRDAYPSHFVFAANRPEDPLTSERFDYYILGDFDGAELARMLEVLRPSTRDVSVEGPSHLLAAAAP